ncbi:MAG: NYN domain-containing protein [Actinomycetota bacterium]|nr:NYN domain-containing protein [Actinomycetota bacterium]
MGSLSELPADVGASLVRGVGSYLRAAPVTELPPKLRRYRGFRPQALGRHSAELLAVLDDELLRGRILEWLDDGPVGIGKPEATRLREAAERADGWFERLSEGSTGPGDPPDEGERARALTEEGLERANERARRAKDEARRARESAAREVEAARAREDALVKALDTARQTDASLRAELAAVHKERDEAVAELERERRKARRALDRVTAEEERARGDAKEARRAIRALEKQVAALERTAGSEERRAGKKAKEPGPEARAPARRSALPVPKGRFAEDKETFEAWLAAPNVHLVVDGYNVAKAEGAYGDIELADQRKRVIDGVTGVARRFKVSTIVVFDGSEVPAGVSRVARGPIDVQYSRPDEIADDHIVAVVETLPTYPVVVVTNDRELQDRCAALAATIARSDQLLALFR